jgi:alkylated DNA repair dioxygenase AlkB
MLNEAMSHSVVWQPSMFEAGEVPAVDATFSTLVRHQLDDRAWVDHAPGWLSGAAAVFEALVEKADWKQHTRLMYGNEVLQPRLNAPWRDQSGVPLVPVLADAHRLLCERYGVEFDSGMMNLYRDGSDSVAWHRDKIPASVVDPIVVILSVGEPRPFRLRPRPGASGRSLSFRLGDGDLLVTGGTTQRTWDHAVPKVASARPRISITMRHS